MPPNSKAKPKQYKTKAQAGLQLSVAGDVFFFFFFFTKDEALPTGKEAVGTQGCLKQSTVGAEPHVEVPILGTATV